MAGGSDLHGLFSDIHVGQLLKLVVHGRQFFLDVFRAAARGYIQINTAVLAATAFLDLGPEGARHYVPAHQFGWFAFLDIFFLLTFHNDLLEPSIGFLFSFSVFHLIFERDIFKHEALTLVVFEHTALTANAIRNQKTPSSR